MNGKTCYILNIKKAAAVMCSNSLEPRSWIFLHYDFLNYNLWLIWVSKEAWSRGRDWLQHSSDRFLRCLVSCLVLLWDALEITSIHRNQCHSLIDFKAIVVDCCSLIFCFINWKHFLLISLSIV